MHNIKQTENALRIELNPPDGIVDLKLSRLQTRAESTARDRIPCGGTNFLGS
jgi:hypothetical protein